MSVCACVRACTDTPQKPVLSLPLTVLCERYGTRVPIVLLKCIREVERRGLCPGDKLDFKGGCMLGLL